MDSTGSDDVPRIRRVSVPVDTRAPEGTTNAYLVDGLLVDPAARTADLDETIAAHEPGVEAIAVTHTHRDHVGAVAHYAADTDATVYAHADHVKRFVDATGIRPDATVRDGDAIDETGDGAHVVALGAPGHAPDHVAFAVGDPGTADPREALVGDLAVAAGSVVVGGPDADMRAYLESLERVRDGGFRRLYPGHGAPIDDPDAACQRLIDHRLDREEAVLAAVDRGASDVDAVLDAAYEKDLTGVEDLARATVVAHLEKLVGEGRIDGAWLDDA
ncbi:MBL fold metallo-hydrolase [Halorubrum sp. DTA98]|uniref:MBL fold metallo-hydrolase n=1 Tax=Halorubrum sp. DTA98 TaxID=3402163 RepID=UPI003AAE7F8F